MRLWRWALPCIALFAAACAAEISDPLTDEHRAQAEGSFSPDVLQASVTRILQWHQASGTEIPKALQAGIPRPAIQERFGAVGCLPPEELMLLWGWRNGAGPTPHPFLWYHNFLSMEQALDERASLMANPLVAWPAHWIPVFEFEGEWYFVECRPASRKASPVGYIFLEDPAAVYAYSSLTRMLETHVAWFQQSAVTWDRGREAMVEDLHKLAEIHRELNEGASFPYYVD